MTPNKLNEWAKQIHENACQHGWHEEKRSPAHFMALIMTEVAEAIEADRNSRRVSKDNMVKFVAVTTEEENYHVTDAMFTIAYQEYIKGTVEEELADAVIRILDMAYEIYGDKMNYEDSYPFGIKRFKQMTFSENAWHFIKDVLDSHKISITDSIIFISDWAKHLKIDLSWHIEQKMKYNQLRTYKHGGKKY